MPTAIKPWMDAISAFKNGCFLHLPGEGTLSSETVSSSPANSRILHAQRNCRIFKSLYMRSEIVERERLFWVVGFDFSQSLVTNHHGWSCRHTSNWRIQGKEEYV